MSTTISMHRAYEGHAMDIFYSLHTFMLSTKSVTYLLMGGGLVAFTWFWIFLFGRDDDIRKY